MPVLAFPLESKKLSNGVYSLSCIIQERVQGSGVWFVILTLESLYPLVIL